MSQPIRSWAAGFAMVGVLAAIPVAFATIQTPGVSAADVCAEAGSRHVDVGGCTNVATDFAVGVAVAGDEETAAQIAAGQPPCYTPSGQQYWTPGDAPCN
jgi:hypothetical protein